MSKVRLKDVAQAAGVSQGTASNVYNRPDAVTPEMRERVLQAAAALDYHGPAPAARALRAGKANLIALVAWPSLKYMFEDPFARRLSSGIGEICDEAGLGLAVVSQDTAHEGGWSIETAIADGFILFCVEDGGRLIELAKRRGLPFVAVDSGPVDDWPTVNIDDRACAADVARHLLERGHGRFAILSLELAPDGRTGRVDAGREGAMLYSVCRDRLEGYRQTLLAAGIPRATIDVYETQNDRASTRTAVDELFGAPNPPTALIAMSDYIALCALERLAELGIEVPREVSVVGFDDVPEAALATPALTSVRQPVEEKGRIAARMLLGKRPERHAVLPAELVVRASTGPAPTAPRPS